MKLSQKVLVVLVVVATKSYAVIASTLRSSSKNDGGGTNQVAQAFPVSYNKVSQNGILFQKFTTEDSTKSKPSSRSHHGDHHDHKKHNVHHQHHHQHDYDTNSTETTQRIILQVRNTLENVDIDKLRDDEIVFFEDSWKIAFQTINEKEDDDHHGKNGDDHHIARSVIVSQKELDRDENRMLRGGQFNGSWFDVWTIVELYTYCCPQKTVNHNDENEEAVDTEQSTALDLQHHFENLLCKMLRKGPHERFHKVKNCKVAFTDW